MPLPLLPLVVLGGTTLVGAAFAADGLSSMNAARRIVRDAEGAHTDAMLQLEWRRLAFNDRATKFGAAQLRAVALVVTPFVELARRMRRAGTQLEAYTLEGVDLTPVHMDGWSWTVDAAMNTAAGAARAVAAGAASSEAAMALVGLYGTASTGTAIGSLSGAAATNATLAWLGGGSLAAGGGGMAAGSVVLGGITLAPILLVGGLVLSSEGEKALSEAHAYAARVERAIAEMTSLSRFLDAAAGRIDELEQVLDTLVARARPLLASTEAARPSRRQLEQLKRLVDAIVLVLSTPILDEDGHLNPETIDVLLRTRRLL